MKKNIRKIPFTLAVVLLWAVFSVMGFYGVMTGKYNSNVTLEKPSISLVFEKDYLKTQGKDATVDK